MKVVVFSPHSDDVVFSIGAHLAALSDDVTVVSPMAGIPTDDSGHTKHVTLQAEHQQAMKVIGADWVNGDFLDDVYPAPDRGKVRSWMTHFFSADVVYFPLGIHHPDHVLVSNLAIELVQSLLHVPQLCIYEELPYRVDYPDIARLRLAYLENVVGRLELIERDEPTDTKESAVRCYESQVNSEVLSRVLVRERIWRVIR